MNITDQLVAALAHHGLPALFAVILAASVGVPLLPVSLMLAAAGLFARQGDLHLVPVLMTGTSAAILGDHVAYGLSRWGGRRLLDRIIRRMGGASNVKKAEELSRRWGAAGVFFTRWLFTELCPWVSVTSGLTRYPYAQFALLDVSGEMLWVTLYVMLGYVLGNKAQHVAQVLGHHARMGLGIILLLILGWTILRYFGPRLPSKKVTPRFTDVPKHQQARIALCGNLMREGAKDLSCMTSDFNSDQAIGTHNLNAGRHQVGTKSRAWCRLLGRILAELGSILPRSFHVGVSRVVATLFECRVSSLLIAPYCRWNFGDSEYWKKFEPGSSGSAYRSFQDFFTRNLRTPIVPKGDSVWPCEGLLCQVVRYTDADCLKIKGEWMRASKIFAIAESTCDFAGFLYTVFLHNRNYHHIHSPVSGRITRVVRIPGKLFLLRPWAYEDPSFPALRNERVVVDIEDNRGLKWSLAIVGGPLVGTVQLTSAARVGMHIAVCEKLASFRLGSTCCVLAPVRSASSVGCAVEVGGRLG